MSRYRQWKKNTRLRKYLSPEMVRIVKQVELLYGNVNNFVIKPSHRSRFDTIVHFGVQKTGSVWFREILRDPLIYKYTGLSFRDMAGIKNTALIEKNKINSPLRFVDNNLPFIMDDKSIAKLIVVRNPIDQISSWIKSTEHYHVKGGDDDGMTLRRAKLKKEKTIDEKMKIGAEYFNESGRLNTMERLLDAVPANSVIITKYEDCCESPISEFKRIFNHLDCRIPDSEIQNFCEKHSFESYSGRSRNDYAPKHSAMQSSNQKISLDISSDTFNTIKEVTPAALWRLYYE